VFINAKTPRNPVIRRNLQEIKRASVCLMCALGKSCVHIHPSRETMERALQKYERQNLAASSRLRPAAKFASPSIVTPGKLYGILEYKPSIIKLLAETGP
jgi:hypothetical protein